MHSVSVTLSTQGDSTQHMASTQEVISKSNNKLQLYLKIMYSLM